MFKKKQTKLFGNHFKAENQSKATIQMTTFLHWLTIIVIPVRNAKYKNYTECRIYVKIEMCRQIQSVIHLEEKPHNATRFLEFLGLIWELK